MTARTEFVRLVSRFGGSEERVAAAWDVIAAGYGEPHRAYHDLAHIEALLGLVLRHRDDLRAPDEVALAVLYHDVVYDPTRGDNETASAALASAQLTALGAPERLVSRVVHLVDMTRHGAAVPSADDRDLAWFLDFDLSTLAAVPEVYDRYAAAIRREYAFVPEPAYREGRARVLRGFLAQPALYRTPELSAIWEAPARANLAREISALTRT